MLPSDYSPVLDPVQTHQATALSKRTFADALSKKLDLIHVSSPKALARGTGLQDDLAGLQEPVSFRPAADTRDYEVVHSLAKWKRNKLGELSLPPGKGLYANMHAIRKDEELSPLHSLQVDQWDWELVMGDGDRTLDFLKSTVRKIYSALHETESKVCDAFGELRRRLPDDIQFEHAQTLQERYPDLSPRDRENAFLEETGAAFIIGIGNELSNGKPHDARAADYDDWSTPTEEGVGLNGDIFVWDDVHGHALELSSMGIRVDADALQRQLRLLKQEHYAEQPFHQKILSGDMPQTIGGGIGQSRVCMFMLEKAHIGEVQAACWPEAHRQEAEAAGAVLL